MKVAVGDEVRIFHSYGRPRSPEGEPAKVTDVRRALFDVEYVGRGWTDTFRLDTGYRNEKDSRTYALTLPEVEERTRRGAAVTALRESFIDLRFGASFTLDQLERLAALVKEFEAEKEVSE